ncbi:MAG: D-alanyl-D-alanine carboxypeptidase family protein [Gemmobacter sp.]|nr:D-alanyl-D-alanine carboxypeptidase family protein [Gemmobacter sp.]
MSHRMTAFAGALAILAALPAHAFETRARAAWVYDLTTQTVLMDKDSDVALPPASMSKLMTLFMLFEALQDGTVSMDTQFSVSARAKAMQGSTMFLDERDTPTVRDLIRGIIVNSGNDACVVVAEGLAGTEEAFSRLMTERAATLGMTNTRLANASGWPHPDHRMSMRDLGILTEHLITDFPDLYPYFNEREFDYKDRSPANKNNRNPLLRQNIGADGLKTGHTSEAGYGLVGSAVQGDRRVIFTITGLETEQARAEESASIVNWAFRQFVQRTIVSSDTLVAQADVWLGDNATVGMVTASELRILVPTASQDQVIAQALFRTPLQAPLTKGQQIGELVVTVPDMPEHRIPLLADADVAPAGMLTRLRTAAAVLARRGASLLAF